MQAII